MGRRSNRDKILSEGLRIVHERGLGGASVRDIVQAAGVPQGSFTNHFASKEAFGLEVLDLYFANSRQMIRATLLDDTRPPLQRLRTYLQATRDHISQAGMRNGCLFGNFSAETSEQSAVIRHRLTTIFAEVQGAVADCLAAAVTARDLPPDFPCADVAGFVIASLQGAILLAKAERTIDPFDRFERVLFSKVLR